MSSRPSANDPGTLLVGISNPDTADALVRLAAVLVGERPWEIVLLHVVPIANQISLTTGQSSPDVLRARDALEAVLERARSEGVDARAVVECARSVDEGILAAAQSRDASMILVGYSDIEPDGSEHHEPAEKFDRAMHRVARKTDTDVVFARIRREAMRSVLVPVVLDAPLRLTGLLCRALARVEGTSLTFFHVVEAESEKETTRARLAAKLESDGLDGLGPLVVVASDDLVEAIVARAADCDLVILGPSGRPRLLEAIISSSGRKIAEGVSASVVLAWGEDARNLGTGSGD